MKRVKVFCPIDIFSCEKDINSWIQKENPEIISATPSIAKSAGGHTTLVVTIVYDDLKPSNLKI